MARKGASSYADIDPHILQRLEAGEIETSTHVEQMAVDMGQLLSNLFPGLEPESSRFDELAFLARMREGGRILADAFGTHLEAQKPTSWTSDIARGWAAFATAMLHQPKMSEQLRAIRRYARDPHFAVREWAWLALRPSVVRFPGEALALLDSWVESESAYDRRYAFELTRPRSVWGAHIPRLKRDPTPAEPLLLRALCDPDGYVQSAVGNWLNDAGKTRPDWLEEFSHNEAFHCRCPHTLAIRRSSLRNLPVD